LGDFWRQWFLERLAPDREGQGSLSSRLKEAREALGQVHPLQSDLLRRKLPQVQARLTMALRKNNLPANFWMEAPPVLRPLTGYLQMSLENADFSREIWLEALEHLEHLAGCL
jgi:hypothetical protein